MAHDINSLMQTLDALIAEAKEPGKMSKERAEEEVKRLTAAVKEVMANLHKELPPEAVAASGVLVDVFKQQIGALLRHCGLDVKNPEQVKKLTQDLDNIKRGFIRG
jgi:ribosomal protein S25